MSFRFPFFKKETQKTPLEQIRLEREKKDKLKRKLVRFKIPFTTAPLEKLKSRSARFKRLFKEKKNTKLQLYLESADVPLTREDYLAIKVRSAIIAFVIFYILSSTLLLYLNVDLFFLNAIIFGVLFSGFVFLMQTAYPALYNSRKQKLIEKNLIPALSDMYVQLNSGIPLFTILVNISSTDYGFLSEEFKKAVKKINAGMPEIQVLEDLGEKNTSMFFRRALWQISNGMRSGSDISIIIKESIKSLNQEQGMQIQRYGNKLNPLIMFYMLASVILPALSVTFLTIISSLVSISEVTVKGIFVVLFFVVIVVQIMFLGMIKSMRPTLL